MTLDVGHRLTSDLEAVANPHLIHNLIEGHLKCSLGVWFKLSLNY